MKPDINYELKATVEDIVKLYKDSAMARGIYVQKDAEEFLKDLHPSLYQNLDELIEGKKLSEIEVYKGMTLKQVQEKIFYNFPLTFLCILAISRQLAGKEGFEELWNYSNLC